MPARKSDQGLTISVKLTYWAKPGAWVLEVDNLADGLNTFRTFERVNDALALALALTLTLDLDPTLAFAIALPILFALFLD